MTSQLNELENYYYYIINLPRNLYFKSISRIFFDRFGTSCIILMVLCTFVQGVKDFVKCNWRNSCTRCDCFKLKTTHGHDNVCGVAEWLRALDILPCFNAVKIIRSKWDTGNVLSELLTYRNIARPRIHSAIALNKFMSYTQSPINYVFTSLRPVTYVWAERSKDVHCFDEKLPNGDFISGPLLLRPIVARFNEQWGCSAKTSVNASQHLAFIFFFSCNFHPAMPTAEWTLSRVIDQITNRY